MRSGCFPGGCEEGLQRGGHLEPSPERNGCRNDKVQMTRAFLDLLISQKSEGSWEHGATRSALKVRGRLGWGRELGEPGLGELLPPPVA